MLASKAQAQVKNLISRNTQLGNCYDTLLILIIFLHLFLYVCVVGCISCCRICMGVRRQLAEVNSLFPSLHGI